jgi:hypothetical protein
MGTGQSVPGAAIIISKGPVSSGVPLTNFANIRRFLSIGVHSDKFDWDESRVLHYKGGAQCDDLYVVPKSYFASETMRDFVELWTKCVNVFSFAVHRNMMEALPTGSLELNAK